MPTAKHKHNSPQVAVVQIGARHHYAIPRMLEKSGHLTSFHTDANAAKGLGRALSMIPFLGSCCALKNLVQRRPRGVPSAKIKHTDALMFRRIMQVLHLGEKRDGYVEDDYLFDQVISSRGFEGADTLYAMQKHGTKLLQEARKEGIRTVVDIFINPLVHRIVENERAKFPDIEMPLDDVSILNFEDERTRREIDHADLLLCPGWNVVEGLANFPNAVNKAFAVVPYGSGISFDGRKNKAVRGRVLFAGTADLRKGIHYLGMAANKLGTRDFDFRVAGNVSGSVRNHSLMSELNFLGRLPREQMKEEFLQADVFVLPTLAEGCASVIHEAVMAGCPVITTLASGTLVEDDKGGVIVPERDPLALADAISDLVRDRNKRRYLAETCIQLADELSEERWSIRLINALMNTSPQRISSIRTHP